MESTRPVDFINKTRDFSEMRIRFTTEDGRSGTHAIAPSAAPGS